MDGDLAKTCGCGRKHTWLEWRDLARVGYQVGVDKAERSVAIELRNCPCGSTLSAPISLVDLKLFLTNPTPLPSSSTFEADRISCRLYASAAKTVIALLEEARDEAFRRARISQKQVVVAEARSAELHRLLLLRDSQGQTPK